MRSARTLWRMCVLPAYMVLGGAVFSMAMARTEGSIIGGLAVFAPWALALSVLLALVVITGNALRWHRRVRNAHRAAVRRNTSRPTCAGPTTSHAPGWLERERPCVETGHG